MKIAFLLFTIFSCLFFCNKRPGFVLAYLLFFQNLNNILFTEVGLESYRYITSIIFLPIIIYKEISFNSVFTKILLLRKTLFFRGYFLLVLYMLIFSLILSTSYELLYLQKFLFPGFILCIVGGLIFLNPRIHKDFFNGILFFSLLTVIYLIITKGLGSLSDRTFEGETISAITQGRIAGIMFIFSFMYTFNFKLKFRYEKIIGFILIFISIFWLFYTGTRGAALASLFSLIFYYFFTQEKLKKIWRILIILLMLLPFYEYFQFENSLLYNRILDTQNITQMIRYQRMEMFLKYLPDYFITGTGPGGWSKKIWGGEFRYPHNIFMEFVIEFGLIGFISFVLTYLGGLKTTILIIKNGSQYKSAILLGWIFYAINVMFSGGFVQGNEIFFIYSAITSCMIYNFTGFKKNKNLID